MKVVVAIVLVLGSLVSNVSADDESTATENFQIRTKIDISGNTKFNDGVKKEIGVEISSLVCDELGLKLAEIEENCKLEEINDKDWVVDETEESEGTHKFSGNVKFVMTLKMQEDTKKSDLKKDIETTVDKIQGPGEGSGDEENGEEGSTESSGEEGKFDKESSNDDIFVDFGSFFEKSASRAVDFTYIDVSSLDTESFVICVGECKDEGFWMMIAFVSTASFCLIISLVSCFGSRRVRYASSTVSTILLLGIMGGMLYVGIVEKVNWKITGGYIGGTVGMIILVNVIGCFRAKKSLKEKVNSNEIESYWKDLAERDRKYSNSSM